MGWVRGGRARARVGVRVGVRVGGEGLGIMRGEGNDVHCEV